MEEDFSVAEIDLYPRRLIINCIEVLIRTYVIEDEELTVIGHQVNMTW